MTQTTLCANTHCEHRRRCLHLHPTRNRHLNFSLSCRPPKPMTKDQQIKALKQALEEAVFDLHRAYRTRDNELGVDWASQVKKWAKLADLDLGVDKHNPAFYVQKGSS